MKPLGVLAIFLAFVLVSPHSSAQSDPSLIGNGDWTGPLEIRVPDYLAENAPVAIQVPSDGCWTSGPRIIPEATTIVREGTQITIDFHAYMMVCFSAGDPPGVWKYNQDLGTFAAGEYEITARYHYIESPGAAPFAVLHAPMLIFRGDLVPASLPTLSSVAILLLVFALAAIGWMRMRRRRLPI